MRPEWGNLAPGQSRETWGQEESGLGLMSHGVKQREESKGWVIQGPWDSPALWGG